MKQDTDYADIDSQFFGLIKKTWHEIFGAELSLDQKEFEEKYTVGVRLPSVCKSTESGELVYLPYPRKKALTSKEVEQRLVTDGFMYSKEPLNNINDIRNLVQRVNNFTNAHINSENVFKSGFVLSSNNVYKSTAVFNCRRVAYCFEQNGSEMVFASEDGKENNYCIRTFNCGSSSNCFEVHDCANCSNSMFLHGCTDLRDCMFCFHLASKQYCIANMQYTKEEYLSVRKLVVDYINKYHDLSIDSL